MGNNRGGWEGSITLSTTVPEYPSTAESLDRRHLLLREVRTEEEEEWEEREP
jgi:hypothetical protein